MRKVMTGFSLFVALLLNVPAVAAAGDQAEVNGAGNGDVETVRKTCECVRRHPNGFPYIEPRITTCKVAKSSQGHVKSLDCLNCYTLCSDKPSS